MGCPKIALTISNTFGIDIDKDVVRRVLKNHYNPGPFDHTGASWLTLIGNLKDSLWSTDLFRVESINLKTHWVMIVISSSRPFFYYRLFRVQEASRLMIH